VAPFPYARVNPQPRLSPLRLVRGNGGESGASDDSALVAAVQRGEATAAAEFHDRLRPTVDRTLRRLVGSSDRDYDDLAQQALIDLTLSIERFRGESPLDAWASVVVARVAYRHIRRRKLERRLFAVTPADAVEPVDRGAGAALANRALLRQIQRHVAQMDVKRAWTFLLHDVYGYDLAEVASITGVSRAAAQSRLVRGRKWLHERIAADPELRGLPAQLADRSKS
jgi:RNA polymerase sigma-70 factor (ECF subfamily)